MYTLVGVQKLSETQKSRLRNGHPVRIKKGSGNQLHLTNKEIRINSEKRCHLYFNSTPRTSRETRFRLSLIHISEPTLSLIHISEPTRPY